MRNLFLGLHVAIAILVGTPVLGEETDWLHLQNGHLKLGIKKSSGGAIGHLSAGSSGGNLLNDYDRGRLVQQSYYGDPDGSLWVDKPWRYNPVQGGDYRGAPATLLEIQATATSIYTKTQPRHWAAGQTLPEVIMEQWIRLVGPVAHVTFQMTYTGERTHKAHHQEVPAIFVAPQLGTLVTYAGDKPWTDLPLLRRVPAWPNEKQPMDEGWVAYVNAADFGVGAYVPIAAEATCYRYQGGSGSDCSYVAPLATFALRPGLVFRYDVYLTIGTPAEMRERFKGLRPTGPAPKPGAE